MADRIERDELYAAVWVEPATRVAAKYGITSTALAKICKKLRVPAPPRGYWAKKAAGHRVACPPLPKPLKDQPVIHHFGFGREPAPPEPAIVAAERDREAVVVASTLDELHPLLRKYEARLRRRREDYDIWASTECIAIEVSREQLDRGLRIMNALLMAFDERGIPVEVAKPSTAANGAIEKSTTTVTIAGVRLHVGLIEDTRWETPPPQPEPARPARDAWRSITNPNSLGAKLRGSDLALAQITARFRSTMLRVSSSWHAAPTPSSTSCTSRKWTPSTCPVSR